MTWTVTSRKDTSRWLECSAGIEYTADPVTTFELGDPASFEFPLTPTGPTVRGVQTPSELYAAAVHLIPAAQWSGELPDYPDVGANLPGIVYYDGRCSVQAAAMPLAATSPASSGVNPPSTRIWLAS